MEITVSIGDLAEYCFPQGSLGAMPSVDRMTEGTRAHKKLQNAYAENEAIKYRREVNLEYTVSRQSFSIKLHGRADGIFFDKSFWYIHEIKSTFVAAASISEPLKLSHKAQMMIYAFIYATELKTETIKCRLSYFCLGDEQIVDFEYTFQLEALRNAVLAMIDEYALLLERRIDTINNFLISAKALKFPFKSFRIGQRDGAAQVYTAIKNGKNLFLQAPTGSGKTVMTLFPAIKATADNFAQIFCLSAKNQTTAVNEQAINLMRDKGLRVKSCTITAKSKICFAENQNCSPEACPYSVDFYQKLHNAMPEILNEDDFSAEVIARFARKYEICPYELSLALAEECQIIMCDYNYLFDPTVYLKRFFDNDGKYVFLIDEAHNLPDRGRDMYSAEIRQGEIREAKKNTEKGTKTNRGFTSVLTELNKLLKQEEPLKKDCLKKIIGSILTLNGNVSVEQERLKPEIILLAKELYRFAVLVDFFNEKSHRIIKSSTSVSLRCLDASEMLAESIAHGAAAIMYSATLSPYDYYKNSIIPNSESFGFNAPYPFDKSRLLCIADYTVDTRYSAREHYYAVIAEKIKAVRRSVRGNIIVYFPSYKFMNDVGALLEHVYMQKAELTSDAKLEFINLFDKDGDILAFAVMGSHFSEGIDFKSLAGIITVGVALPQYNRERSLLQEYFQEKYGNGFEYAYVYPGICKVCQAAGRLIRTESDSGFILLMDERFRTYRSLLPAYWDIHQVSDTGDAIALINECTAAVTE